MRQRIEVIVVSDIDVDEWVPDQKEYEKLLSAAIKRVTKEITGSEGPVDVFIDYGDVV